MYCPSVNFAASENCVEVARSHDSNDEELELGTTCLSCVVCSPTSTVATSPTPLLFQVPSHSWPVEGIVGEAARTDQPNERLGEGSQEGVEEGGRQRKEGR